MTPTTTKPNQLERIAQEMRTLLDDESGPTYVRRVLFGGLQLLLQRKPGGEWRLAIARTDTTPSATEANTVAKAFRLPPVEWEWTTKKKEKHAYVGRGGKWVTTTVSYRVAECRWRET